ncbi:bifunctional UDP-N-acetylglucosamine diphosphorylase/glucosamine-1-phosphate N-acetyltransferase GlmU [bacterium]|nr:bifunctional UDP-N-acetylglucosamine diphosphorylase/glucosamine-1-phosphate N-acetyltransferase GlmU [bacterium]
MKRAKALNSVILAAGDGTRLRSNRPKVLHEVCGHPMLHYVLRVAAEAAADRHVIVVGYEGEQICQTFAGRSDVIFAEQKERLGTGHAVQMTREAFEGYEGDILILAGDTPLLTAQTLQNLVQWHRHQEAAVTILTTEMPEPRGYGRILRYEDNRLQGIVEEKDANRYERAIREINTGSYCFDARALFEALDQVTPQNVQNEYYLTDCVRILVEQGHRAEAVITDDHTEAIGVNTRVQLAEAEKILRQRILVRHMMAGITILDPETCYVDEEVEIGKDSVLFPGTMITGKSRIGADCRIGPNTQIVSAELGDGVVANSSYIEGVKLPSGATVGPFATLRNTTPSQKDSGN